MPKNLVLDTNVYVSFLTSRNPDSMVVRAVEMAHQSHHLFQSPETFAELSEVLQRPKFARYFPPERVNAVLEAIRAEANFIEHGLVADVSRDPKDNKFFALAEAANADFILSGDTRDVLSVLDYKNAQTIAPVDFLDPRNRALNFSHHASHIRRDSGLFVQQALEAH